MDQALQQEIEDLTKQFETLKTDFDAGFTKLLQQQDFNAYPTEDQQAINNIKTTSQKLKDEINQSPCSQSELVAKKKCLLAINQKISTQKTKFQIIQRLINFFQELQQTIKNFKSASQQ